MMATKDLTTKPAGGSVRTLSPQTGMRAHYDTDLYSWALQQAGLLRAGRLSEIDAPNIAEELVDVGNEQYDKLESALAVLLMHLLKWDRQPERRSRSWESWSATSISGARAVCESARCLAGSGSYPSM